MKIKMLAAVAVSGLLVASTSYAAPSDNDNIGSLQGPTQLADSGMSGNAAMSGTSNISGTSNMSGTSNNNMSGTASPMSGASSPSDEGSADTATGDDY